MPVVATSRGAVRGTAIPEGARMSRRAVRHAAPLSRARPGEPWDGERDATRFAPPAPAGAPVHARARQRAAARPRLARRGAGAGTERVDAGHRGIAPVMVNFHGGAFVAGTPSSPLYDGAAFARDGVVLVDRHRTGWASRGSSRSREATPTSPCATSSPRCGGCRRRSRRSAAIPAMCGVRPVGRRDDPRLPAPAPARAGAPRDLPERRCPGPQPEDQGPPTRRRRADWALEPTPARRSRASR